jgi:tetratricopeptide (TPR) repeat protein
MPILRSSPALLTALLLAACATRSAIDESRHLAKLGEFSRAFVVLDDLRNEQIAAGGEVDPKLAAAHRVARMEYLLHNAEQLIYGEDDAGAMADLVELETLDPDYPGITALRARIDRKRAERLVSRGEEALVRKDFARALVDFWEAKALDPAVADADEGIKAVQEATGRMSARAQEQFLEAVRKLPEFRFVEVQWHASNVLHNTPGRDEAKQLVDKAKRENALAIMARGKQCEEMARYGAALIDYRTAKATDPTLPGIDAAIASVEREHRALVLVENAEIAMLGGRFAEARELLGEAFELSVMARNDVGAMVQRVRRTEGESRYSDARDLQVLGKKEEALAAFEALAKDWPNGLLDESARIDSLRVDLEGARTEWEAAEAAETAGDLPKALEHYENSERYYPKWRDGKARIARLRAAIQASGAGDGAGRDAPGTRGS